MLAVQDLWLGRGPGQTRAHIRRLLHHQTRRSGDGPIGLPRDRRGAWRQAMGDPGHAPRRHFSADAPGERRRRICSQSFRRSRLKNVLSRLSPKAGPGGGSGRRHRFHADATVSSARTPVAPSWRSAPSLPRISTCCLAFIRVPRGRAESGPSRLILGKVGVRRRRPSACASGNPASR